jgi:oligopeptidase A
MSADAFMAFAEVGTANEPEVRRLGRLFRNTFFALGGSVPTAETFRRFRGREPKVAALITYNELSANTTRGTSGGSSGTSSSGSSGTSSSGSSKAL